jgi:hypothetical protein
MDFFDPAMATLYIPAYLTVSLHVGLTFLRIMVLRLSNRRFGAQSLAGSDSGEKK